VRGAALKVCGAADVVPVAVGKQDRADLADLAADPCEDLRDPSALAGRCRRG